MRTKLYVGTRRSEELEEYFVYFLKIGAIILSVVTMIVLYLGERNEKSLDEMYGETTSYTLTQKQLSLDELMWRYIDSLPLPKEEVESQEISIEYVSNQVIPNYTEEDIYLLAQLMYAEEEGFLSEYQEDPEKVEEVFKLCGSAVLRRVQHQYLGSTTIRDVIFKDGQYADRTLIILEEGQEVPELVYSWAEDLLVFGPIGPKGMIYQSESKQGEEYKQIGNQIFGIEPKYN